MKNRKGFIFSIIAILFMMLLILLASTMANEYWENERGLAAPLPNSYASASLENIENQILIIVLPSASIDKSNISTRVYISDSLPRQLDSYALYSMKTRFEDDLANTQHANISIDTTQVANNSLGVLIMDRYIFQSTLNNSRSMIFRADGNASSTGATRYNVSIRVNDYRSSVSDFSYGGGGAFNVTVIFTDRNGTVQTSGSLNPGVENHLIINYFSGKADIVIGRARKNTSIYDGALWMNLTNVRAIYDFTAELPVQPSNSSSLIMFPIEMNYSQDGVQKVINASR